MNIEKAKALKYGDKVICPRDRGSPGFVGTVVMVGDQVNKNIRGDEYVWVTVKQGGVWPSNRLG